MNQRETAPDKIGACKKHKSFERKHKHPYFITPIFLLLLDGSPSSGYNLMAQIKKFDLHMGHIKPGVVYATLLRMEQERLVKSKWDIKKGRVPQKVYSLTPLGKKAMKEWFLFLKKKKEMLDRIVIHYEKWIKRQDSKRH